MASETTARTRAWLDRLAVERQGTLIELFAPGRVTLVLGGEDAQTTQAQLITSMLTNLLMRGFPVVQHLTIVLRGDPDLQAHVPRWRAPTLLGHLSRLITSLGPDVECEFADEAVVTDVVVQVGERSGIEVGPDAATIFVGAEGWTARLSSRHPVPTSPRPNPVGSYAAACLAAGEVWKLFLKRSGAPIRCPVLPLDGDLSFSTYSLLVEEDPINLDWPDVVNVATLDCIGVGAGGGATLFTLASGTGLRGRIRLVDPDEIDTTNLNRYVFADESDAQRQRPKVDVLQDILSTFPDLQVERHYAPHGEAGSSEYEYVAAAVHSRDARREIEYETPRVMWDAGATEDGEFRLWRLAFGATECMWCKHPLNADDPDRASAEQLSSAIGLSPELWLDKLRTNAAFTASEIAQLRRPLTAEWHLPEDGERFGAWFAGQCGRLPFDDLDEEIPMPFAPVMAGVLVAGEIVKEHHFPSAVLGSYYWNTLLGRFMSRNQPRHRGPSPDCQLCSDPDFIEQYKRRWGQ